jgi:hypothetical protein
LVTMMLVTPAAWAGVVQVREVALTTATLVQALPPTVTDAPLAKPVPVTVIPVSPASGPPEGLTELTVGAAL